MILFGFILFLLLFIVGIIISSIYIVKGLKEKDSILLFLGVLLALCVTLPCIKMMWILIDHI